MTLLLQKLSMASLLFQLGHHDLFNDGTQDLTCSSAPHFFISYSLRLLLMSLDFPTLLEAALYPGLTERLHHELTNTGTAILIGLLTEGQGRFLSQHLHVVRRPLRCVHLGRRYVRRLSLRRSFPDAPHAQ